MVALLAEGVDRNICPLIALSIILKSPSSRRAWIEILSVQSLQSTVNVALLAEGVDRNILEALSRREGGASPSSRRAWIEIA